MSVAKFKVTGQLDGAGGVKPGTLEIDRETGTITVRPLRSRTTYSMTLGEVATFICLNIIRGGKPADAVEAAAVPKLVLKPVKKLTLKKGN